MRRLQFILVLLLLIGPAFGRQTDTVLDESSKRTSYGAF